MSPERGALQRPQPVRDVDRSEVHNLAAEQPDRLRELIDVVEIMMDPRPQLTSPRDAADRRRRRAAHRREADPVEVAVTDMLSTCKAAREQDFHWLSDVSTKHYHGDDADLRVLMARMLQAFAGISVEHCTNAADAFLRGGKQDVYRIPPERVIGSSNALRQPIRIWSRTGRRPIVAGGNSNGDIPMLRYAGGDLVQHCERFRPRVFIRSGRCADDPGL